MDKTLVEQRRLEILRFAERAPEYTVSAEMLARLLSGVGLGASRDHVVGALAWLDEAGLVELSEPGGVLLATATARGCDVAAGRARHPGVSRPGR